MIQDRIKEFRRVPASALQPHPRNWRTHPDAQRDALRTVLEEIGFADALLVRELADGGLQLIDGHLRAQTAADALTPVLVLDVDEQEAERILLTHDPIAAMAQAEAAQLDELLSRHQLESPALQDLLKRSQREARQLNEAAEAFLDRPEVAVPESFQVVVQCADEAEQERVYQQLCQEGRQCRVLTL